MYRIFIKLDLKIYKLVQVRHCQQSLNVLGKNLRRNFIWMVFDKKIVKFNVGCGIGNHMDVSATQPMKSPVADHW